MRYLKTNTATIVTIGPFLDKTDGVTLETGLTITNERISFVVDLNDGSAPTLVLDNVTGATSGTSNDLNYITGCDAGLMQLELAAANVNYLGRAFLTVTDAANHCPVFHEFTILPAMVYDSLIAGTDVLQSDMTQILGTAVSTPATAGILDVNLKNIANATVSTSTAQLGVNVIQAAGTAWGSGAITAASIAADAITAAKIAAGAIDNATFAADVGSTAYATNIIALAADKAIVNYGALKPTTAGRTLDIDAFGSIENVLNVIEIGAGGIAAGAFATDAITNTALASSAVGEIQSGLATAAALATVDTVVDAIKVTTDKVDTALVLDGAVYQYTANALELAPTGGSAPTAAAVADAVWDEVLSGHLTAGTTGNALNAAGSAGDPWSTALPGAYGAGTAGKLIGDNINAPIATVDTVVDAIKVKTDYLPSATAGAAGGVFIAGSNAATSVTTALTANITGNVSGSVGSVTGAVGSVSAGGITASSIATGAIDADALAADAIDEILDEVVEGSTTVRMALRALLSLAAGKSSRSGSTIYLRDIGDTKNRVAITHDSNADRTAVTVDLT